jgi:WD40 repeat protein
VVLISHDAINTLLALDGRLYISVDSDRSTVKLTDTARQRLLFTLNGHPGEVTKLNLSPDSSYLATSDSSGTTIVWDLQTGQSVATLTGHTETIRYVVFSHDGR